jgi:hypothetical protein
MPPTPEISCSEFCFSSEANQAKMQTEFGAAMAKMALIGQKTAKMVDCSDVIPVPKPVVGKPHLPAGKTMNDIEQAVRQPHMSANRLLT